MKAKLTIAEKLLLAALNVREESKTFSAEDLVVRAWELYPDSFGLAGYADQYPDSNRVLTNIMGSKGMRGKGWLRKVGQKQYRVTSKALSDGAELMQQDAVIADESGSLRAELDRKTSTELDRLVDTRAAKKILDRVDGTISFADACGFWDITVRSNANTLRVRLHEVSTLLERALLLAEASDGRGLKLSQHSVTASDLDQLIQGHQWLQERFAAELGVIRQRDDERLGRPTKRK
ncbi:MAG: hypothetical protein AAFR95_13920 [Bacteroidota bacterium]